MSGPEPGYGNTYTMATIISVLPMKNDDDLWCRNAQKRGVVLTPSNPFSSYIRLSR